MLGLSIDTVNDWANRLYIVFTVVAIAGAALALIASFFMWRTGAILSRVSDEKISALQADTAQARLEQEKLHTFNLQLQQEVERERIERLSLEKDVSAMKPQVQSLLPPKLLTEQAQIISKMVPPANHGVISIVIDMGASSLRDYVADLGAAFSAAGWAVAYPSVAGIVNPPKTGVAVLGNQDGLTVYQQAVSDALKAANIAFDLQADRVPPPPRPPRPPGFPDMPRFPGQGANDVEIVVTFPRAN